MGSLAACGGGDGGGEPVPSGPAVKATVPASDQSEVSLQAQVTARFDTDVLGTSVSESSFTLRDAARLTVPSTVTFDGENNVATLQPGHELALLTRYTATATTAITDLAGDPMAADHAWNFTTQDGMWREAEQIETDNTGIASAVEIAADTDGNAIAVWSQSIDDRWRVVANRFVAGSGWEAAQIIDSGVGGRSPDVAVDQDGNIMAVWIDYYGTIKHVWARRYVSDSGWQSAQMIETNDSASADYPRIALDSTGNGLAVWNQDGDIWANRFTTDGGWAVAQKNKDFMSLSGFRPQIGLDQAGNALILWSQSNGGSNYDVVATHYIAGLGWETANSIESSSGNTSSPQLSVDASGNALAVWKQYNGTDWDIYANLYVAGTGWQEGLLVASDTGSSSLPKVSLNDAGAGMVVWAHHVGSTIYNVVARAYSFDGGWATGQLVQSGNDKSSLPQVAVDDAGNAMAIWSQSSKMHSNRYVEGQGWQTARLIKGDGGSAIYSQLTIGAGGKALAAWAQNGESVRDDIWASWFE